MLLDLAARLTNASRLQELEAIPEIEALHRAVLALVDAKSDNG